MALLCKVRRVFWSFGLTLNEINCNALFLFLFSLLCSFSICFCLRFLVLSLCLATKTLSQQTNKQTNKRTERNVTHLSSYSERSHGRSSCTRLQGPEVFALLISYAELIGVSRPLTTNQHCITSHKSEDVTDTAAEACNHCTGSSVNSIFPFHHACHMHCPSQLP